MSYFCKQKFLRHQVSPKTPNLSAFVHILHTFCGHRCQSVPRRFWPIFAIFQKSRFLTFLRKSPKCAMKVAYPPNERVNLAWSSSRYRQASSFVDFGQILIKNRKKCIFWLFPQTSCWCIRINEIEKIFTSTDLWLHSGYFSYSRWSRMTLLESPNDGFVSIYPQFSLKKWRC